MAGVLSLVLQGLFGAYHFSLASDRWDWFDAYLTHFLFGKIQGTVVSPFLGDLQQFLRCLKFDSFYHGGVFILSAQFGAVHTPGVVVL